jgi:hypothetical protein
MLGTALLMATLTIAPFSFAKRQKKVRLHRKLEQLMSRWSSRIIRGNATATSMELNDDRGIASNAVTLARHDYQWLL